MTKVINGQVNGGGEITLNNCKLIKCLLAVMTTLIGGWRANWWHYSIDNQSYSVTKSAHSQRKTAAQYPESSEV